MSINFDGVIPIPIGKFGDSKPTTILNSIASTETWVVNNLLPPINSNTNVAPLPILCTDTQVGGSFIFYSPTNESISNYEYRVRKSTDSDYSDWITCTSFKLSLANANYPVNGIQIRHIADSKLASPILSNKVPLTFYEFEINILDIYFTGYIMNVKFISKNNYIVLVTNGYRNAEPSGYTNPEGRGPFTDYPNPSVMSFDFSNYKGSFQRVQLQGLAGGYITPIDDSKYGVKVPN